MIEGIEEFVVLPKNKEEYEALLQEMSLQFEFEIDDDNREEFGASILRHDKAFISKKYLGNAVRKFIANKLAYEQCQIFMKKRSAKEAAEKAKSEETHLKVVPDDGQPIPIA